MTTLGLPAPRALGWGASVALHGGAAAFLLLAVPAPEPPPAIVPLEIAPVQTAPAADTTEPTEVSKAMETVVAETATTVEPPDPVTAEPPQPVTAEPPPAAEPVEAEPVTTAAEPEIVQATPPEPTQAATPETAPILEPEEIPPPPPAPPPPPRVARPPAPTPPRPQARTAPPAPRPPTPAPTAPVTSAPAPAAAPAPVARRMAGPPPSYLTRLSAALERAKRYPNASRLRREEGQALLQFRMRRDGSVVGWRIVRSTGYPDLDEAVGEMIQRASLPSVPDEMEGSIIEMVVPVNFNLR